MLESMSFSAAISNKLELSGISRKQTEDTTNASLTQKHKNGGETAETFAIPQIGLTCITWKEANTKTLDFPSASDIMGGHSIFDEPATYFASDICVSYRAIAFPKANNFPKVSSGKFVVTGCVMGSMFWR